MMASQACSKSGFFYVPPRFLVRLKGADRLRYLNGQVTNDLRKLVPGEAMQACLLTPKGKLSALLWITLEEDALLVEAPLELAEELPARLERYIVADDVTFEVVPSFSILHVFGPLMEHLDLIATPGIFIQRLGIPGKDIPSSLVNTLPFLKEPLSAALVEALRIKLRVPRWGFEVTADRLPAEARLEQATINYEKGCYLGQEVISRLRSVGHVNRLLVKLISAEKTTQLKQGMEIFSKDAPEKKLGFITSAAWDDDADQWVALGYLARGCDGPGLHYLAIDKTSEEKAEVVVADL